MKRISNKLINVKKIQANKDVEGLIEALKDEDEHVRSGAAEDLRKIGEPAVGPLIEALKDEDWRVRMRTAWALGEIKDARAVGPLTEALKDEDDGVRWQTEEALCKIRKR